MDKTAIIVLHYKNMSDTYTCIKSISDNFKTGKKPYILVVANSSIKDDVANLKKKYRGLDFIENPKNQGFAEGNNLGLKKVYSLGFENYILLNNDTVVSSDLINQLVKYAKVDDNIGLISPKIYFEPNYEYHKSRYQKKDIGKVIWYAGGIIDWQNIHACHRGVDEVDSKQYDLISETDFATGCCMFIKRKVIEQVGFFDTKYFLYYEDVDYSMRVKLAGFKIVYLPRAYLWHKNASSSGKPGSSTHIYYQNRNRFYFGFQYASWRLKKSLFIDSLRLLIKGGNYSRAVIDYYSGHMGQQ
ncbi:hypothetical protein A2960_00660 [Candidatus Gottesmanbacteria bacterium RIFCSPLOWO2_01_FULL_39_12b]|uniref:Glycosyltransferase 2-like domain-containing protein n=1 Tax=Candidatus Gottesmanbacteria bacterium RIFCSPLOWO2_01_FULL_39_12b TaxID=1798388 RepID=A0A1F6APP2_9BACT|nr:MAG: hypothetical protein A2960_00660 [Candidatus Gottesmanbacteria bacterium RIFCSPLOWO2_01_FULL_39_12b]